MNPEILQALNIINNAQQELWNLHHQVKDKDEALGMKIWEQTMQIEHALLVINEKLLGGSSYYENKDAEEDCKLKNGHWTGCMTRDEAEAKADAILKCAKSVFNTSESSLFAMDHFTLTLLDGITTALLSASALPQRPTETEMSHASYGYACDTETGHLGQEAFKLGIYWAISKIYGEGE